MNLYLRSLYVLLFAATQFALASNVLAAEYYVSPTGNDANQGTYAEPWYSFTKAWQVLQPGDTLILQDGIYLQTIRPTIGGTAHARITIKAEHDGQAIIDGQYSAKQLLLLELGKSYFTFEGLVFRNGTQTYYECADGTMRPCDTGVQDMVSGCVIQLGNTSNNIFRRISAYHSNTNLNYMVACTGGKSTNNLFEDVVFGGKGRKTFMNKDGDNNTYRRMFSMWTEWDGRNWHDHWPWGEDIEIYGGDNNTFENVIAYGAPAGSSLSHIQQGITSETFGNKWLGSIAAHTGVNLDGTIKHWGCPSKPEPCSLADRPTPIGPDASIRDFDWFGQRVGFNFYQLGGFRDNLYRDLLIVNNAGLGLSATITNGTGSQNNVFDHITMKANGLDGPGRESGTDILQDTINTLSQGMSSNFADSDISNVYGGSPLTGQGARLTKRYVDGILTTQDLWPWPMEDRIKTEFARELGITNFSPTCVVGTLINEHTKQAITNIDVLDYCSGNPPPTPTPDPNYTPAPSPTGAQTPTPTSSPNDLIVTASSHELGNGPEHTIDGDFITRWSAEGNGEWIQYQFVDPGTILGVDIAVYDGSRENYFDIQTSADGQTWTTQLTNQIATSQGSFQSFDVPDTQDTYLRFVGRTNSINNWNSYTEIRIVRDTGSPPPSRMDLDGDGDVDIADYMAMIRDFFSFSIFDFAQLVSQFGS